MTDSPARGKGGPGRVGSQGHQMGGRVLSAQMTEWGDRATGQSQHACPSTTPRIPRIGMVVQEDSGYGHFQPLALLG